MTADKWNAVAVPIMRAVSDAEDQGSHRMDTDELAGQLGVPHEAVQAELRRLLASGHVTGEAKGAWSGPTILLQPGLGPEGARAVGAWPNPYDALLAEIDERISAAPTDEERSRLQRYRAATVDVGKATLAGVLVEAAKATLGSF